MWVSEQQGVFTEQTEKSSQAPPSHAPPQEGLVCGVSGPVCIVLRFKGPSGGAPLGRDFLGSGPQNRTCGMWCGGEPLSYQSLFSASGVYF